MGDLQIWIKNAKLFLLLALGSFAIGVNPRVLGSLRVGSAPITPHGDLNDLLKVLANHVTIAKSLISSPHGTQQTLNYAGEASKIS